MSLKTLSERDGRAYAGLTYQLIDYEDIRYPGTRDASDLKVHHEARYWQAEHSV
jgi:hypothetical protein